MSMYAEGSILDTAITFVGDKISVLDQTAAEYSLKLQAALGQLGSIEVDEVSAPTLPVVPATPAPAFQFDNQPKFEPGQLVIPPDPEVANIKELLEQLDIGDMDDLPDAPTSPVLHIPDAPGMASIPAPARPDIDTDVALPDAPTIVMPEMEALEQIKLPDFEFPVLPDFQGNAPEVDFAVPNPTIQWAEPQYESEVLDELVAKVRSLMAGGTGLPPAVEDALFARARERESAETRRAVQEAMDTWAARGFTLPTGMLDKQVQVLREQGRDRAAALNRDILVQAAQWEIENLRFAVTQGMALEQLTSNIYENTAKRMFEVAKFQAEAQINVFNAQVGLFNARVQAFGQLAQVYRTKLDGALAKLQAYKTAIDGQVALGQINQQKVEVFKAKLAGVQASVEVFTSLMRGAQVKADVIKNQFDAYRADVQAYAEQLGAEKIKFDAYEAQVKGETAKASMLDAQARAYASTIQGLASKADIRAKQAQLRLEAARVHIAKYASDLDGYRAKLDASLKQLQMNTTAYQAAMEGWKAKAQVDVATSEVHARFADMQTRTNIAYAEMQISQYQANIQKSVQKAQIAIEAAKAMGQYAAQLAAGAMSAMHVSASVSGSGSASSSQSQSTSTSTSHNYSY